MRRCTGCVFAILAFIWSGAAAIRAEDPVVPVYHEPHHRQVFQYETTRILDVQIPPGDTSWYHTHESPILYVTLSNSQNRIQNLGQDWNLPGGGRGANPNANAPAATTNPARNATSNAAGGAPPAARVSSTTSYVEQPVTHRLQNVGDRLFRLVAVINEAKGDDLTSQEAAGFAGKAELTNRWFRAYRFTVAPGESTSPHRHQTPVVIVQATDGRARGVGAMKFDFTEAGRWAFFDAGDAHEIRNMGTAPVDFVEVEVRRPAQ